MGECQLCLDTCPPPHSFVTLRDSVPAFGGVPLLTPCSPCAMSPDCTGDPSRLSAPLPCMLGGSQRTQPPNHDGLVCEQPWVTTGEGQGHYSKGRNHGIFQKWQPQYFWFHTLFQNPGRPLSVSVDRVHQTGCRVTPEARSLKLRQLSGVSPGMSAQKFSSLEASMEEATQEAQGPQRPR